MPKGCLLYTSVEEVFQVLDRRGIGQVALVVLHDNGQAVQRAAVHAQVGLQALQGLQVVALEVHLGIGHKDHSVRLPQHELQRGVVGDLAGNGVEEMCIRDRVSTLPSPTSVKRKPITAGPHSLLSPLQEMRLHLRPASSKSLVSLVAASTFTS